jgi:hypothetical protein
MQKRNPYTFKTKKLPLDDTELLPDQMQGVHFTVCSDDIDRVLKALDRWYEEFEIVVLVATGTTNQGMSFVIMEWEGCEIDPEFIEVLENDETVGDFSVYIRDRDEYS